MKRGGPLRRYVGLRRFTPLPRGKVPMRRKVQPAKTRSWHEVRQLCFARADGRCDYCGQPLGFDAFDCHHRRRRSQLGDDNPITCIAVHRTCHEVIHRNVRVSLLGGFLCKSWQDPAARPMHLHHETWVVPRRDRWDDAEPQSDQAIGGAS